MNWYLLDTNHAGMALRDSLAIVELWRDKLQVDDRLAIAMPSVGELWYMVYASQRVNENALKLRQLIDRLIVCEYDPRAAEDFGRINAELRRVGRPIPQIDVQIAAVARTRGMIVASADSHFENVPHLRTINLLR